jgi:hypothetical protein
VQSRRSKQEQARLAGLRVGWSALQGAERHAMTLALTADAEYRDCSCPGAEREAEWSAHKDRQVIATPPVLPNPSLKRSANSRPPGPVWRYAVHFRQPGPGVLPSSPA